MLTYIADNSTASVSSESLPKQAGEFRSRGSKKRAEADRARQASSKTTDLSNARTKRNEAERRDKEASTAGKEANRWQKKASEFPKEEGLYNQNSLALCMQSQTRQRGGANENSSRVNVLPPLNKPHWNLVSVSRRPPSLHLLVRQGWRSRQVDGACRMRV